jgi:SAM-dependent methyltransferase
MQNREDLQRLLDAVRRDHGEWSFDIPLPFGVWTRGNLQIPHTRLKRVVQVVSDLAEKPLAECRILDLGCLDGIYSIEFAKHGANTIGVEIREANIKRAIFCKEALGLRNLEFRQDDVRNINVKSYGKFDAIVCSGILYHLPAADVIGLVKRMYDMVGRLVVIDTHVALQPGERFAHGGDEYWGKIFREHADDATPEEKAKARGSSADNTTSFWFTRPSLVNLLSKAGFSSVYECFIPAHLNFGRPGIEHRDRCTFVAIKEDICNLVTSPSAERLEEKWPEHSLSYAPEMAIQDKPGLRAIGRLKRCIHLLLRPLQGHAKP